MESLSSKDVLISLQSETQNEVLKVLANLAFERGKVDNPDVFFTELCKREQESTTGFGNNVAIPHARHNSVKEAGVLFARTNNDIEWNSIDGEPVRAFICLIAPNDQNDFHLKTLSKLSRQLIHEDFIELLKNGSEEDILSKINSIIQ